ncbi:ABC transporter substrate-binding protein [Paenibacillus sp. GCM10023252]|uniref:ABC transporter substrate-binding protein n=1 Tax=Paenibacillus sp. GCM10023252 TaxID=3252649 RepID=UPI0036114FC0
MTTLFNLTRTTVRATTLLSILLIGAVILLAGCGQEETGGGNKSGSSAAKDGSKDTAASSATKDGSKDTAASSATKEDGKGASGAAEKEDGSGTAAAAAPAGGEPEVLELKYQGWTGSVTIAELAENLGYLAPIKLKWIGNTISGPQDIQAAATGDVDFGGAFNGAVVKLVASNAPITPVVSYYGTNDKRWNGFFVLEDSPIKTAKDLIGKKVGMNTLGAHGEIVLKNWLQKEGLTKNEIKDVTLVALPPVNLEQSLRGGQIDVAVIGDIVKDKALERGGIRSLASDYDLFGAFNAGTYVIRKEFIKENPNTTRKFVEGVAKAIEWLKETPVEESRALFEKIINERGRKEDASAVKYFKSSGVAGKGGLISDQDFQIWIDWLENEGQLEKGKLKPSEFYTNEFNPFFEKK